jgi:ABC-2 type transport system permease protein
MNPIRITRVLIAFTRVNLQSAFAYRWGSLVWIVNGSLGSFLAMAIWVAVGENGSLNMNNTEIISYYIYSIVFSRLTQTWSMDKIGSGIKTGSISLSFLRPYHYLLEVIAQDFGDRVNRLLSLIPFTVLVFFIFYESLLYPHVLSIASIVLALFLSYFLKLFMDSSVALLTYWAGDLDGIERTYSLIRSLAAGVLMPLALMPEEARNIFNILPFRYFHSFPLELTLGQLSRQEIAHGFVLLFAWGIVSISAFFLLDSLSSKNYSAHGG